MRYPSLCSGALKGSTVSRNIHINIGVSFLMVLCASLGPAKVSVYRGEMKQTFLRVPAVHVPCTPVDSAKGIHIVLASENASRFTASLVIEDVRSLPFSFFPSS